MHFIVGLDVEGDIYGTVGAFLSGAGSILTALGAIHYERKRGEKICEERFASFREGIVIRDRLEGGHDVENDSPGLG